jgi:hypothetical protein
VEHGIHDDLSGEHFEEHGVGEAAKQGAADLAVDTLIGFWMLPDGSDAPIDRTQELTTERPPLR